MRQWHLQFVLIDQTNKLIPLRFWHRYNRSIFLDWFQLLTNCWLIAKWFTPSRFVNSVQFPFFLSKLLIDYRTKLVECQIVGMVRVRTNVDWSWRWSAVWQRGSMFGHWSEGVSDWAMNMRCAVYIWRITKSWIYNRCMRTNDNWFRVSVFRIILWVENIDLGFRIEDWSFRELIRLLLEMKRTLLLVSAVWWTCRQI